ncbi:MAG: D-erythrulose 4-kinase [Subtercola sp.]|nr:D-erythrulose 4-kinase [Subtercola sp.]
MTKVFNNPTRFVDDSLKGFLRLYPQLVEPVYGGVVRSTESPAGKVAVVIGGGSGHYPAFAGWVGPGLADGAVVGNVFASPSTQQIYSVAKAAETGGGVFFSYGNYAGDVLNFDLAQERLRAEGIDTQTVAVSDDVTSADASEWFKRRGVAGDLPVFKIAGAAAEEGYTLAEVTRVAGQANASTFSFGVAFAGCTLPGSTEPLFTVPKGKMEVGMGVHGEPGIAEQDVATSAELAALLVERLLTEKPAGAGSRAAVIVNGLGGTKYEELFVLFNDIAGLLDDASVEIVAPEVGELITSLDMAGASLTLVWLDDELERLWLAETQTPAFRRGSGIATTQRTEHAAAAVEVEGYPDASDDSRAAASALLTGLTAVASALHEQEEELGRLDAIAGDGDHGRGMTNGADAALAAATKAVDGGAGIASTLAAAGDAWADKSGGTSGALWGNGLRAASETLSDTAAPTGADGAAAVQAGLELVLSFGKAELGDKTMLDALIPFVETLNEGVGSGLPFGAAWLAAAEIADAEAVKTAELSPRIGRARPLAARSIGHADPGAVSLALVMGVIGKNLG